MSYLGGEADTVDDIRKVARRHWRMGADFVKVVTNGGGTPRTHPWIAAYSQQEIAAAVAEARSHETHITVHANLAETIRSSVIAGTLHRAPHVSRGRNQAGYDEAVAEEIVRRGRHIGHTLTIRIAACGCGAGWDAIPAAERA
jgi:hypothetical protein